MPTHDSRLAITVAAAAATAAAASAVLLLLPARLQPAAAARTCCCWLQRRLRAQRQKQAFVLMVTLRFGEASQRDAFLGFWKPLVEHVRVQEPGTLAFELLQSDSESQPHELLVFERYVDKDYYLQVHKTSAAMAAFKQRLAQAGWQPSISGQSYVELDLGFM